jgi:hypothetical protein
MKIQIVKNKYINGIFLLMLFSAAIHMLLLFYVSMAQKNFYILNYFNIVDFDILFPSVFKDTIAQNIVSLAVAAVIYFIIIFWNNAEENNA